MHVNEMERNGKLIACTDCARDMVVGDSAVRGSCSICTQKKSLGLLSEVERDRLFGVGIRNRTSNVRPRGWKWMKEFVDVDGTVYFKGKEQPKLKGTRPKTDIAGIKAVQVANKAKREANHNKKLLAMAAEKKLLKKAVAAQKDFLNHKVEK